MNLSNPRFNERAAIEVGADFRRLRGQPDREKAERWAVILAGGDGTRLLPLTRRLTGDDRPKQFCALGGGQTLLEQTRRRVAQVIPRRNALLIVTRSHELYFRDEVRDIPLRNLLIQPANRGTALAIAWSLIHLNSIASEAIVSFFPSDHHFRNNDAFAAANEQAYAHAEACPDRILLLGVAPDSPEEAYGWIEPGLRLRRGAHGDLFAVQRFWEKPTRDLAVDLMTSGCLWNSFVMVGRVRAFLKIIRAALPQLIAAFEAPGRRIEDIYAHVPAWNFSTDVLSVRPEDLAVLPARGVGWTDLGEPRRVLALPGFD